MSQERKLIDQIDSELARLFLERMAVVERIALEKKASGRPVEDLAREKEMIDRLCSAIEDDALRGHYEKWLRATIGVSKDYQADIISGTELPGHNIIIERRSLANAG